MKSHSRWPYVVSFAALIAVSLALSGPADRALAQSRSGKAGTATTNNVPNALQGFSKNRNQQIHIEASSLEVNDKNRVATFRGKVQVKQGDTELRSETLVVYYEQSGSDATSGSRTAIPNSGTQRIRLLEAKGNVVVTQKDQIATGNTGIFDMRKNTITMRGNVVVSQGKNVLRGDRLVVDMTTAVSRIESDGGRVQGLFQPSEKGSGSRGNGGLLMPRIR